MKISEKTEWPCDIFSDIRAVFMLPPVFGPAKGSFGSMPYRLRQDFLRIIPHSETS